MNKDEALRLALEALEKIAYVTAMDYEYQRWAKSAITAIKTALEAKDEKQKPVNIKKVAEEHGINLPTEFVPKHDESKAAIQSLTDQCAALIWERDELQKQMWRSEKQEPVATICTWHKNGIQHAEHCDWDKGIEGLPDGEHSLYTTPPPVAEPHKRTWVGLTDEDWYEIWEKFAHDSEFVLNEEFQDEMVGKHGGGHYYMDEDEQWNRQKDLIQRIVQAKLRSKNDTHR